MAKMNMKRLTVAAFRNDRKAVLETLQRCGLLDIDTAVEPEIPEGFFRPDTDKQRSSFERTAAVAGQALTILNESAPASKGFLAALSGRRIIDEEQYRSIVQDSPAVVDVCHDILNAHKRRAECEGEITRLHAAMDQLAPWSSLDVAFSFPGTKKTAAFIGTIPAALTEPELTAALTQKLPEIPFEVQVQNTAKEQTCLFLLCSKADAEAVGQALRLLGFSRPAGTGKADILPREEYARMEKACIDLAQERTDLLAAIVAKADQRDAIEATIDYYASRAEKYHVIGELNHSRHVFLITGYVAEQDAPALIQELTSQFTVVTELNDADPDKAPVRLKNNAFAAPAETITEMYSLPTAADIDPSPITGFFYYFLFGMMLSDAGYGLLMVLACFFVLRKCHPESSLKRTMRLFLYCGISTTLWGLVFGSFFGDVIPVIAQTFFNTKFTMPHLLDPMNGDAVTLLIISVVIGLVQTITGLCVKFYMSWRSGDRTGAIFDTGFWITALLGLAMLAGSLALPSATVLRTAGASVAIASAVGLLLTQGRHNKGFMKVIGGLASLYDVTGYVSDLLSFTRLMALGLTTAAMSSAFNLLGTMMGGSLPGVFLFVAVFLAGHAVNFGLNALGAYVHTLRLQYVELFSKFYEGGGKPFHPFAFRNKYTKFKEEDSK